MVTKRMTSVLISNSVGGGFGFQLIELAHLKLKERTGDSSSKIQVIFVFRWGSQVNNIFRFQALCIHCLKLTVLLEPLLKWSLLVNFKVRK